MRRNMSRPLPSTPNPSCSLAALSCPPSPFRPDSSPVRYPHARCLPCQARPPYTVSLFTTRPRLLHRLFQTSPPTMCRTIAVARLPLAHVLPLFLFLSSFNPLNPSPSPFLLLFLSPCLVFSAFPIAHTSHPLARSPSLQPHFPTVGVCTFTYVLLSIVWLWCEEHLENPTSDVRAGTGLGGLKGHRDSVLAGDKISGAIVGFSILYGSKGRVRVPQAAMARMRVDVRGAGWERVGQGKHV